MRGVGIRRGRGSNPSGVRMMSTIISFLLLLLLVFYFGVHSGRTPAAAEDSTKAVARQTSALQSEKTVGPLASLRRSPSSSQSAKQSGNEDSDPDSLPITTVTFEMSPEFAQKWQASSERLRFSSIVKIESSYENKQSSTKSIHLSKGTATFYGKSSLKLKYTTRRSLEIHLEKGFSFPHASLGSANTIAEADDALTSHFLLLSLWEDQYRLAYVSSIELLKELGLFFSHAQLVELRCSEVVDTSTLDARGVPLDHQHSSVTKICGKTLGVYLMIEYPSDAIVRAVSKLFAETKLGGEGIHGSSINGDVLRQRVCEADESFRARMVALEYKSSGSARRTEPNAIISTRNWMYFEKPAIYDVLDIPSFARNSSLSPIYRKMETGVEDFSTKSLANRGKDPGFQYFDLDLYLSWVAVNTLLRNGDYDDEVFFYSVSKGQGESAPAIAARYFAVMAWDYDSVFSACHRNGANAAKSELVFCGETPIEKLIVRQLKAAEKIIEGAARWGPLAKDYLNSLACVLSRVGSVIRWRGIVERNKRHLSRLLLRDFVQEVTFSVEIGKHTKKSSKSKRQRDDTFVPPSSRLYIERGAADLVSLFAENHGRLVSALKQLQIKVPSVLPASNEESIDGSSPLNEQASSLTDSQQSQDQSVATDVSTDQTNCPLPVLSHDEDSSQNPLSLFARKIVAREHKGSTPGIANWVRMLLSSSTDKKISLSKDSILFWLPDGASVSSSDAPHTFDRAGLYCLSALGSLNHERRLRQNGLPDLCERGGDESLGAILLPFVVRDKVRGKAEFATPTFEKPPISAMLLDSYSLWPSALAQKAQAATAFPISLEAIAPTHWYGANTALSLPDDTHTSSSPVASGRRFPVVFSARSGAASSSSPEPGPIVKENFRLEVRGGTLPNDDQVREGSEAILLRGRSAMTVVVSDTSLGADRLADKLDPSREGPLIVVRADAMGDENLGFTLVHNSISPSADQALPEADVQPPQIVPPLDSNKWQDFGSFLRDHVNAARHAENAKRFNRDQEAVFGDQNAPLVNGNPDLLLSMPPKDITEIKGLFLLVSDAQETLVGENTLLVVPRGSVIMMKGPSSKIVVDGGAKLILNGTKREPITILAAPTSSSLPSDGTSPTPPASWDTILMMRGGTLEARWCFVTGSGVRGRLERGTGKHHTHSSAITVVGVGSAAILDNTFFLYLNGAALTSGLGGRVEVRDSVVQWAELGVECVLCDFVSENSIWALFPSWTTSYADNDNDAMYLSGGNHVVRSTIIAYAKDDGIDTGTPEKFKGGDGGSLLIENTIIEMISHEALALSSSPKGSRSVSVASSLIQLAQQGVEVGYSGQGLRANVRDTIIRHCAVGARFGDNYRLPVQGSVSFDQTQFVNNSLHTMNYLRQEAGLGAQGENDAGKGAFVFNNCFFDKNEHMLDAISPCYRAVSKR